MRIQCEYRNCFVDLWLKTPSHTGRTTGQDNWFLYRRECGPQISDQSHSSGAHGRELSGPKIDLSALIKKIKGNSSAMINNMNDHAELFRWQEGYYASTVTPSHLARVQADVQNQKQHHADGTIHSSWEETG